MTDDDRPTLPPSYWIAQIRADLARRRETAGAIQRIRETDTREIEEIADE